MKNYFNPFRAFRTGSFHKPYRAIPISRLAEFKVFKRLVEERVGAKTQWRFVFRGPRAKNSLGQSDSFTAKANAHSFDVYVRS